jgi:hypothetical protein
MFYNHVYEETKSLIIMLTIIRNVRVLQNYPFDALDRTALVILGEAKTRLPRCQMKNCDSLLRTFECFLQITGRQLSEVDLTNQDFGNTCRAFVGSLYSKSFIDYPLPTAFYKSRIWLNLLSELTEKKISLSCSNIQLSTNTVTVDVQSCIDLFNSEQLVEEKVWLWRGWPSTNRNGCTRFFPLLPVYRRLGRKFTEHLYSVCDQYFSTRKGDDISCLNLLTEYIGAYLYDLSPTDFQEPGFVGRFWFGFCEYYFMTGFAEGKGARISTLSIDWRHHFTPFVKGTLIPSGLFAEQWGEFPSPDTRHVHGSRTHLVTQDNGVVVKTKLLTYVPLHVSDEEAIRLLFESIQHDVDVLVNWAEKAVKEIWNRYQNRQAMAPNGQVRRIQEKGVKPGGHLWMTDRNNPDHLQNAAATLAWHGYTTDADADLHLLYPSPRTQTAKELGLPVTNALISHCVLLVASHPAITPSFLEKLELFDKNGKLVGFMPTDSGYRLVSHKDRRGHKLAQQIIPLTPHTEEVVRQIIALTQPLRDYLKEHKDDSWRYLFLTCGQGFAYPGRIKSLSNATSLPDRSRQLADALGETSSLIYEERLALAKRFSLQSLRASAGVLVYLNTKNAEKMAKALGHKNYDYNLLSRYLPDPLLVFFQERWIRIFQVGMIVEALKESEYLLQATDFQNMDELHAFLNLHALKTLPEKPTTPNDHVVGIDTPDHEKYFHGNPFNPIPLNGKHEVVFGVNTSILTVLISLQMAVEGATARVCGKAVYWAGIGAHLVTYLESDLHYRQDLRDCLATAQSMANPATMREIILAH